MTTHEKDAILPPRKPQSYEHSVDNIFARLKTNVPDQLLEFLSNYYPKIKLSCEINPDKFLDAKICCNNCSITTKVHRKFTKLT